jgi:hypothetical protein
MYDGFGRKMGVYRDRRYATVKRYYISNQSEWGRRHGARRYRVKADTLEELVVAALASMFVDRERLRGMLLRDGFHSGDLNRLVGAGAQVSKYIETATPRRAQCLIKAVVERIELSSSWLKLLIRVPEVARVLQWDCVGLFRGDKDAWSRQHVIEIIDVPASAISMKRELTMLLKRRSTGTGAKPNRRLVGLLQKARIAQAALDDRSVCSVIEMSQRVRCHRKRFTRVARLNYLAPDIIASIRDGTQPPDLTCKRLMEADLPMDWRLQRRLLGFPDQPDFLRAAPGW